MVQKRKTGSVSKTFDELWQSAKTDIFRLQLLNIYLVEQEAKAFRLYKSGKRVDGLETPGFKEWLSQIEETVKRGVRVIDIRVIDLPMSEYHRFVISTWAHFAKEKGEEIRFIEREKVAELVHGFEDYWMFDSDVVIPMRYDAAGHFIEKGEQITDPKIVSKYAALKTRLDTIAVPMDKFLSANKINLGY